MSLKSINPATGETIQVYNEMPSDELQEIIEKADQSYQDWRGTSFPHRAELIKKAAALLHDRADSLAELMTREMGKPIADGRAEAQKCAWCCHYFAENAHIFLKPEIITTDASKSFVTFQPLGVILAIMPWNFPFWQVFRFAAPALMAGNAGLLKHASNVTGCALAIESIFHEAGFPQDLFRTLLLPGSKAENLIENRYIRAVTLTGSGPAGRAVAAKAGQLLKKSVLELGGSDPYVILSDAGLSETVPICVTSRLINSGQSCIAAKRFIVPNAIRKLFETRLVALMRSKKMGDPMDEDTIVGPLARYDLRDELHRQVLLSVHKGAKLLLGGHVPEGKGAFYPPTVLTDVGPGMPAYEEELFGPVAAIIPVKSDEDAIRVANDNPFGLGAAVFTSDSKKGENIAVNQLEAGSCFVNSYVKSDPRLPFGGIRESGYGRELAHYGIKEFVNIKTVYIK